MTDPDVQRRPIEHAVCRFWKRIPLVIRAVVLGFLIFEIGAGVWIGILVFIPYAWLIIVITGVLIFFYWMYFSGTWWHRAAASTRRKNFRTGRMSPAVWKWGLLGAVLAVVVVQSAMVLTFRIIEFPAEAFTSEYSFDALPLWTAWLFIVLSALVAGIFEETGFRGYMQVPLEKRYGPVAAIIIVSLVFLVIHLHQAWAPPILIHIFAISTVFGIIAYTSGSLIPGMIAHFIMDIFNFSYWWSDVAGRFERLTIAATGIDSHFTVWLLIFAVSTTLFFLVAFRTMSARKKQQTNPN